MLLAFQISKWSWFYHYTGCISDWQKKKKQKQQNANDADLPMLWNLYIKKIRHLPDSTGMYLIDNHLLIN